MSDVNKIKSLDSTDNNIEFSSQNGPCRYVPGESYELRSTKAEKILESIKNGQVGPSQRELNRTVLNNFKRKIENGE